MKDLKGKVAVISGAGSGIGRGLAEKCVHEGMKVVLADIDLEGLDETVKNLNVDDTDVLIVLTDVSREDQIKNLAQKTIDKFGADHLLFNNAGIEVRGKVWEQTTADWQWIMNVNLWSVIYGIRVFVPIMLDQKTECHIVNTASGAGLITGPTLGSYRVTKSGIIALSETLYHELKMEDAPIGVSVLYPAFVRSKLIDAERNRPDVYKAENKESTYAPYEKKMIRFFRKKNEAAISPLEFADIVFEGIRENKLYIETHPELKPIIQTRMDNILNQKNPSLLPV